MKVVLLDNIKGIGTVGSVKEVRDGYARNFLLPKGLAKSATEGALKEAELLKVRKLEAAKLAQAEAEAVAKKLEGATVVIPGRANEKGKLFSAISTDEIAQAASTVAGAHITSEQVKLDEPLKTSGPHAVVLQLIDGVSTTINVDVQTT